MAKLGDFYKITSGGTPSRSHEEYYENGSIPWVKTGDLKSKYLFQTEEKISELGINNSSARIYPANTVLFAMYGATIGATSILKINAATNQACAAFVPREDILPEYLYAFLESRKERFIKDAVGGAQPNLSASYLKSVRFDCISLEKQKNVTRVLNRVYNLISLRKQQLAKLDELVSAKFVEMFGNFKNNSKNWPIVKFDELAKIDGNMTTDYEKYADYPHIGIDSIEKETGELKGYRTVKEDGVVSGKYIFTPQHIIYSKIRPNLNKVALPDFEGLCSADAYPILPNPKNCNRIFLALTMRSDYFLDYILQFSARTNLPKVNRKEIAGFSMPLPPLSLQNDFATFVERVSQQKQTVQQSLEKLELMKKALMQEYFG